MSDELKDLLIEEAERVEVPGGDLPTIIRGGRRRVRTRRLRQATSAVALSVVAALFFAMFQGDDRDAVQPTDKEPAELLALLGAVPFSATLPNGVRINHLSHQRIEDGFGVVSFSDIRKTPHFRGGVVVIGYRVFVDGRDFFAEQTEDMGDVPGQSVTELDLPYRNKCASFTSDELMPFCFVEVGDVLISIDARLAMFGGSSDELEGIVEAAVDHLEFVSRIRDEGDIIQAIAAVNGVTLSSGTQGIKGGDPDPTLHAYVQFLGERGRIQDAWSFTATASALGWQQEQVSAVLAPGFRPDPSSGETAPSLLVLIARNQAPVALPARPPYWTYSGDADDGACPVLSPRHERDRSDAENAARLYLERRFASLDNFSGATPEFRLTLKRNKDLRKGLSTARCGPAQERSWWVQGSIIYPPGHPNPSASIGYASALLGKTPSGWIIWSEIH